MRILLLAPLAAVAFLGCSAGPQLRSPCVVTAEIHLVGSDAEAEEICRGEWGSCPDEGCQARATQTPRGCADVESRRMVVQRSARVVMHELEHFWTKLCLKH